MYQILLPLQSRARRQYQGKCDLGMDLQHYYAYWNTTNVHGGLVNTISVQNTKPIAP